MRRMWWPVIVLGGGVVAIILLIATVIGGKGPFDRLVTDKSTQRSAASQSQGSTSLATVLLHVDGMVCYG